MFTDRHFGALIVATMTCLPLTAPRTAPAPETVAIPHSFAGTDGSNLQGCLQYDLTTSDDANGATPSGDLAATVSQGKLIGPFLGVATNGRKFNLGAIYAATPTGPPRSLIVGERQPAMRLIADEFADEFLQRNRVALGTGTFKVPAPA